MPCFWRSRHYLWQPYFSRGISSIRGLPSLETFQADHFGKSPVVFRKAALSLDWEAFTTWLDGNGRGRFEQLKTADSDVIVPVEIVQGSEPSGYNDDRKDRWQRLMMPFHTFVDVFLLDSIKGKEGGVVSGYCAQHALFDSVPSLEKAISNRPSLTHAGRGEIWSRNVWLAGGMTATPIHKDPQHGLFVQVIGSKSFRFFPPSAAPDLYLFPKPPQTNTSVIAGKTDWDSVTKRYGEKRFSRYKSALKRSEVIQVDSGDMLYIPKGWFHAVESVDPKTMSVNYFWE